MTHIAGIQHPYPIKTPKKRVDQRSYPSDAIFTFAAPCKFETVKGRKSIRDHNGAGRKGIYDLICCAVKIGNDQKDLSDQSSYKDAACRRSFFVLSCKSSGKAMLQGRSIYAVDA